MPLEASVAPSVVLSYGLGVDSTAILLRWIYDPSSRDFDLDDLLVITAMTGDEWSLSGQLVTEHILPLLRDHKIRYVQVARKTASTTDIIILDDSRSPERLYIEGSYKLSDEMFAAGTIPQYGGVRKCSIKAKGEPLDTFLLKEMNGARFRHVIGFESSDHEQGRAARDKKYDREGKLAGYRVGEYPLIEWGWFREDCLDYIYAKTGASWPKSACTFCPFALAKQEGREQTLVRFEQFPSDGAKALYLEHVALALNPAQSLCKDPLSGLVSQRAWDEFEQFILVQDHALYEVRRTFQAKKIKETGEIIPDKRGHTARSVTRMAEGTRQEMIDSLYGIAARVGRDVEWTGQPRDLHHRLWMMPRPTVFPGVEQMLTIAPAVVPDKRQPNFEQWWIDASKAQRRIALAA